MPKKINKKNVLLTGVGGPAGVNMCKLLMKEKKYFNIFGIDINSHSAGQFFSHQFFICERVSDEKKYLDFMSNFIKENKIDIVVPTVAEELILMEKLQKKILPEVEIVVSSNGILELCDHKDRLYTWMTKNFGEFMGKWQRLNKKPNWKSGSYFIKPIKGRGSRGCRLVTSKELDFLMKHQKSEMKDFIAMEVLPGREWTVDAYVNKDGSFAYIIPRLRLGLSGGISQIGKTDKNLQVIDQTKKVFEKLQGDKKLGGKILGPVFIQWKESFEIDKKTKEKIIKMVEINPRASGGLTITAKSGGDAALCMKKDLIDFKPVKNASFKEIVVTRYFEEKVIK